MILVSVQILYLDTRDGYIQEIKFLFSMPTFPLVVFIGTAVIRAIVGAQPMLMQTNSQRGGWRGFSGSLDSSVMLAGVWNGQLWRSTDRGITWVTLPNSPMIQWQATSCSNDGIRIAGVSYGNGNVYISSNSGQVWSSVSPSSDGSADGSILAVTADGYNSYRDYLWISTDFGATWSSKVGSLLWKAVAMSLDGSVMVAGVFGGALYISKTKFNSWLIVSDLPINANWHIIRCNSDCSTITAAVLGGGVYISLDFGSTWSSVLYSAQWISIAIVDSTIAAASYAGAISFSRDSGRSWTTAQPFTNKNWAYHSLLLTSNASRLVAGSGELD